jgi:3-hydroxyisobutyrate dehydrogenase
MGIDPRRYLDAIEGAPFDMQYAHWKGGMMISGEYDPAFTILLAHKDVGLMLEAARDAGVELPTARLVDERFGRLIDAGFGEEDIAALFRAAVSSRLDSDARPGAPEAGEG